MGYWLFVLLNAVLLVRPEELVPEIAGLRLYLLVMGLCLVTAGPRIIDTLQPSELRKRPITVCVLGVWASAILSQLARGQIGVALDVGSDFGKVILYYLLLVSVLDTPARLRSFLGWLVGFVAVLAILALLQYHGVIDVAALAPLERRHVDETGEAIILPQLQSSGIFNDPNDLCLILVAGSLAALARAATTRPLVLRLLWAAPVGLFGYSVILTQSRGGFLGLLMALLVWAWGRFGWKRVLPLAILLVPAIFLLGSGRQTSISLGREDTAHARTALWSEGLVSMMRNPITGIGAGEYADEVGQVAHNSFVHAYVELGIIGGALFLGAFYYAAMLLYRLRPGSPRLATLRPFVLAMVIGFAGGVFSLSRNYVAYTYLIIGLADVFVRMAIPMPPPRLQVGSEMAVRMVVIGVAGWIGLKVVTQVLFSLGG